MNMLRHMLLLAVIGSATAFGIGGQKDPHGCLPGAGYKWCAAHNKCERPWMVKCPATGSGSCTSTPGWRDQWGTCATYLSRKWCTAQGKAGTGWQRSWGALDRKVTANCCGCGKKATTGAPAKPLAGRRHPNVLDECTLPTNCPTLLCAQKLGSFLGVCRHQLQQEWGSARTAQFEAFASDCQQRFDSSARPKPQLIAPDDPNIQYIGRFQRLPKASQPTHASSTAAPSSSTGLYQVWVLRGHGNICMH